MSHKRLSVIPVLFVLILSTVPLFVEKASAGEPIFMANTLVNWEEEMRTFKQEPTGIACTDEGRIYVSYSSGMSWNYDTYISYSDDSGSTWSGAFRIDDVLRDGNESNDDTSQAMPRIAVAPNGTLYAVWQDHRDKTHTQQIRIAWSTDGENFSRSVRIDPFKLYPNWDAQNPNIGITDSGRIVVAWEDRITSGSYWNVYCSYSDDGGVTWSEMVRVNTDNMHTRQHEYTRIAVHGGDVYITWHDNRGDGQYRPYLAASHDGGETFAAEKALSDDLELYNSRQWPSPAVDDSGNVYVTWRDKRSGFDEIWFTRSEDGGATFSDNKRVAIVPEGAEDWWPATAATGNGTVSVSFTRRVPTDETKDEGEIFFINSSDGGRTWDRLMRVDDTDQRWDDLTTQRKSIMMYDILGRAMVAWADERNGDRNNYYSDVWFSRHSGDLSGPNHLPKLYDVGFVGNFTFNPKVGSPVSPFFFSCNYSDEDNDKPLPGYPRLFIYNDTEGRDPLLPGPVVMEKAEPRDIDYINGAWYRATTILKANTSQLYYRIEVLEERATEVVSTPLLEGPVVDANPPVITVIQPSGETWLSESIVRCRVRVVDMEGGNVNPNSIKVRKSITGPDNLDKGVPLSSIVKIDNNTYTGYADVRLEDGKENYIQFEAKDMVRNQGYSEMVNIWLDSYAPYYSGIGPGGTQLYERVNCTIDWMDHLPGSTTPSTGMNVSSIQYSYKTTSGPYSEWLPPEGIREVANGTFRAWVNLDFENNGVYNYIRWRASDNIGNTRYTDDDPDHPNGGIELKIRVKVPENYPPQFVGDAYPDVIASPTPHFFWDDAFDEEGDTITYRVMVMKNGLQWTNWIDVGERTFFDVPDSVSLDPDWYVLRINATDGIGGFDLFDHPFRIVDKGTPPPEDIPVAGDVFTSRSDIVFKWPDTPSWAVMNITYWIRIGSSDWHGDVLDWTPVGPDPEFPLADLNLSFGIYSVQYMAENNGNFSRVSQSRLKINDYDIEPRWNGEVEKFYRGKGSGIRVELFNWATFSDNVTVKLSGEVVDRKWVYLNTDHYAVKTHRMLSEPEPSVVMITVFPPKDAGKGTYSITLTVTSEDGETVAVLDNITIKITDKDQEGFGGEITDTLHGLITDIFPFLKPLSPNLVSAVFLMFALVIVGLIVLLGIYVYRRSRIKDEKDPYAEQRQLYRELYGSEPTQEQLEEMMKESSVVDEVMSDLSEVEEEGPKEKTFDESFLESEKGNREE